MSRIRYVIKRSGAKVPFTPERITNAIYRAAVAVGGRDRATAEDLARQVVELLEKNPEPDYTPHIEEIQDLVEKVLIENAHARVAKAYILYRDERTRRRAQQEAQSMRPSENIPWAKIWHVLDWAVDHGLNTVEGLNKRIRDGEFSQVVTESEAAYSVEIENAVRAIFERRDELRMIIITGPSSSGKTTTTIKVGEKLKNAGMNLVTMNLDNYFFDLEMHPKDEFGDYDFETPHALDLALINEHIKQLIDGKEVMIPFYDFKTGKRTAAKTPMKIKPDDLILIDSLHGLFPAMTEGVDDSLKFRLYLEPLMQMKGVDGEYVHWTDIRLIRRMLRDASHRAYDPRQTLEHWHYVRTSEMRHIIPNINDTDILVNSAMPYEMSLYAARIREEFNLWAQEYRDNPLKEDAFIRADRVARLLTTITPVGDDSQVPLDSVIREFIGGSTLKY
ncbi:MAG TPA: ATP cone domain-containing protein [Anaerolineaceae bacterium]|nr:ATP cone domain-containing protein [Anaerolineaceae bacterium]